MNLPIFHQCRPLFLSHIMGIISYENNRYNTGKKYLVILLHSCDFIITRHITIYSTGFYT